MCKVTQNNPKSQGISEKFSFKLANSVKTEANLNATSLSNHGGALLLQETMRRMGIVPELSSCIHETRTPYLIKHSMKEIIFTSILLKCFGYEDCNDCDFLRKDPMMQFAVKPESMSDLCSQPTMTRFENSVTEEDLVRLQDMFVQLFVASYEGEIPEEIILDCDDTNIDTYGKQELTLFNTYYDSFCYMPLLIFEGHSGRMIQPLLRPGRKNKSANINDTLQWLITELRHFWPHTRIIVRGDSHFCSYEFMEWADDQQGVYYITGISQNNALNNNKIVCLEKEWAKKLYRKNGGEGIKLYNECFYAAKTWAYAHKVVFKVEYTSLSNSVDEQNVRYIVTNLTGTPQDLYEKMYCGRGNDELYIREFKEAVNGDRLSCHSFNANRFRIFMHAAAYMVMHRLRMEAMKGTKCETSALKTIRDKVLHCAVSVRVLKTKVVIDYAKYNPMNPILRAAMRYYALRQAG